MMSENIDMESQYDLMKGKCIVVVGGGDYRLRNIWTEAAKHGIKVILVDADPNHVGRPKVNHFIHYDFSDHSNDTLHAREIYNLIVSLGIKADGCLTFWDECVPLAALISEKFGTRGISYQAAMIANSKARTQNVLNMDKNGIIQKSAEGFNAYSSRAVHLKTESDCDILPESFKFPAILKLDHGSSGVGACVVENKDEMKTQFRQITSSLQIDSDFPGIGLSHGNSICTMEFYTGTEHNVDVILYDGKLIGGLITDNGKPRRPFFIATVKHMPSVLPEAKQEQLIEAAYRCCTGIGLSDGTFNVEFMMTEAGPKLLEINARMGGYCLRDWMKKLYDVDIMLVTMMIACGIKPSVPKLSSCTVLLGVMVLPSLHSKILKEEQLSKLLKTMRETEEVFFLQFSEEIENSLGYDEPFGNIAVSGSTTEEAKRKLMEVCDLLEINCAEYHVDNFIKPF